MANNPFVPSNPVTGYSYIGQTQFSPNEVPEQLHQQVQLQQPRPQNRIDNTIKIEEFPDFISNSQAQLPIVGTAHTLRALRASVDQNAQVYREIHGIPALSAYTPITIALNDICRQNSLEPVDEAYIFHLRVGETYQNLAKLYLKSHFSSLEESLRLSYLADRSQVSEDIMAVIINAFVHEKAIPKVVLGIVIIRPGQMIRAIQYPPSDIEDELTAWILADFRSEVPLYFGISGSVLLIGNSQLPTPPDQHYYNANSGNNNTNTNNPTLRKPLHATKFKSPLPADLSVQDILNNHTSHLHYANVLKVGLESNNKAIATACRNHRNPNNRHEDVHLQGTAIVKRILTGIRFVSELYDIDVAILRMAYDEERKAMGIACRVKGAVDEDEMERSRERIQAALAWIRRGGPLSVEDVEKFGIDKEKHVEGLYPDESAVAAQPLNSDQTPVTEYTDVPVDTPDSMQPEKPGKMFDLPWDTAWDPDVLDPKLLEQ